MATGVQLASHARAQKKNETWGHDFQKATAALPPDIYWYLWLVIK